MQAVYREADEQTKRGFNQAFFKKLYVMGEWDEEQGETVVWISGVELTEPYALLLSEGLFERAETEARALRAGTKRNRARSTEALCSDPVSIYEQMAERAGFEPAMEFNPHTRLAGECLQPLGHLSLRLCRASV